MQVGDQKLKYNLEWPYRYTIVYTIAQQSDAFKHEEL